MTGAVAAWVGGLPRRAAAGALLSALLAGPPALATASNRIEAVPGPAQEAVVALCQDRAGFLWIGTRQGLYLYDGQEYRVFEHDPFDPASLSDNDIRTLYEDAEGTLWIGTNTGGLDRLDRGTWTFEHFRHDSSDPASISHDSVYGMARDADGYLWVGTQIGLNRLDTETGRFDRYRADPADPTSLGHDYVFAVHAGADGNLWIGMVGGGLDRLDPRTGTFTHFRSDPDDPTTLPSDLVFGIAEAGGDAMWIGTGEGLARFHRETGLVERIEAEDDRDQLITSLTTDDEGTVWIGTFGSGLGAHDPRDDVVRYRTVEESGDDRVIGVVVDRAGTVWIGTWSSGLYRLRAPHSAFALEGPLAPSGSRLDESTVVAEDDDGGLWVGTWGRGLTHRRSGSDAYRRFLGPGQVAAAVTVLSIERTADAVWFGTMGSLERLDPRTGRRTSFEFDPDRPDSLGRGYVSAIFSDSDGTIWAGTGGSGLYRLREDGRGFDAFRHDEHDPATLSEDYVTTIAESRDGTLWVGTRSGGLNALDRDSGVFRRFLPDPADPRSLGHHYVTSILEASDGRLWVGTAGGGLNRLERDGDRVVFVRLTERDGLSGNNVMGLAEDTDGSLWLGTRRGLSRLRPETGEFVNFTGIAGPVFLPGGVARGAGRLYFATRDGVVTLPLGTPFPEPQPSPVVMTAIQTLDGPLASDRPVWELDRIEVPYGEVLSFKFVVLDYGQGHRYAYRLDTGRDRWVDLGQRREITFTDLEPGEHVLTVRGRNDRGVWSEAATPVAIRVVPPFWMTSWFRGGVAAIVVLTVLGFFWVRTSALERRNRELLRLKDQREVALAEARVSQEKLATAYENLRRLTRRLEAAKEDERKRIARELHDEMGQALSAAKISLQRLARHATDEAATRVVEDAITLINGMIDHVRTLSLDLRPPLLDELGLVPALQGYAEGVAHRTGLAVRVSASQDFSDLPADETVAAFRVVQEALTNVVRHADAGSVDIEVRRDTDRIRIAIRDDGRGFDLDAALARGTAGHHLGLLGMRERIEALGGAMRIETAEGRGTVIRVAMPVPDGPTVRH